MPQLIVIGGLKRSASAWQFNVVRLFLLGAGYSVQTHGNPLPRSVLEGSEADFFVCKTHRFYRWLAEAADLVFVSRRRLKDVAKSLEKFNQPHSKKDLESIWEHYMAWARYAAYDQRFADVKQNAFLVVADLKDKLVGVAPRVRRVDPEIVYQQVSAIKPPKPDVFYDSETMMFSNHFSKGRMRYAEL